jgi:2-oxoglutarate ferredoxin oxidoreductase subunit beta
MDKIIEAFHDGINKSGRDREKVCIVTDIAYDPEVVDYLGVDLFHTNRGRAIAFATGMKLSNPNLILAVFIGDMATLGGNHFVHAARRNMDLFVVCVNDFSYRKVAGQEAPGDFGRLEFLSYCSFEQPLNIPHLARSNGAVYVARWTASHQEELVNSMAEALPQTGFRLIDVIAPKPELLEFYHLNSETRNGEDTANVSIEEDKKLVVGKFMERERETFLEAYNEQLTKVLGDKFVKIEAE